MAHTEGAQANSKTAANVYNSSQKVSNIKASHQELLDSNDKEALQQLLNSAKDDGQGLSSYYEAMMNIKNHFATNEYNDDEGPAEDLKERDASLGEFEKKSRSRSRQQQPRQTNLTKSPAAASKMKNNDDGARSYAMFEEPNRQGLGHHLSQANLQLMNKSGLCSIEEVVSNRQNSGPRLEQSARNTQLFKHASQSRVADYAKNFSSNSAQMRNTMSAFFQSSGFQK